MCNGFPFEDPNYEKSEVVERELYPKSKILNILFASALARRSHNKVEAISVSPGCSSRYSFLKMVLELMISSGIGSQLSRHLPYEVKKQMGKSKRAGADLTQSSGFFNEDGAPSDKLGSLDEGTIS